jgi:phage terminase large subunit-like protein
MQPKYSTSCVDWESKIVARQSIMPCGPLFPEEAEEALGIFKSLRIVDAAGSPTFGEVGREWVFDFVSAIFGSCDPDTGRRLIRHFLLAIAKKNSKSTVAAGIMLTALVRNWRPSAEFLIVAPTVEVAGNSFFPARDMIREDPELAEILRVSDHTRTIEHRFTHATLRIIAADAETVSGKKAVGVLVDELWLFGKRANAENLMREALGGLASRPEGFAIYLSTQSDAAPSGVWAQQLNYFRAVRDGTIVDLHAFPAIFEFPRSMIESGAYLDRENFFVTNPNIGASVDEDFLADELRKSQLAGEASVRGFASKHLNVELSGSLRSDGWAGAQFWDRGVEPGLGLTEILERSDVCTVGVDGGGLDDLLGIAVLGREKATRHWLVWVHAFVAPEGYDRKKANHESYNDFIKDGDMTIVRELPDDLEEVIAIVNIVKDAGLLGAVGVDAMGLPGLIEALTNAGITQEAGLLQGIRQGISLMGAAKAIERGLIANTFKHGGQRLLAWCASNAKIVATPTAVRIARDESGFGKIDAIMALFNAADAMTRDPKPYRAPSYSLHFIGRRHQEPQHAGTAWQPR